MSISAALLRVGGFVVVPLKGNFNKSGFMISYSGIGHLWPAERIEFDKTIIYRGGSRGLKNESNNPQRCH